MGKANKTNLTGGDLPNVYTDNAERQPKAPRLKKKDVFGAGGIKTAVNTGGGSGGGAGGAGGAGGGGGGGGA